MSRSRLVLLAAAVLVAAIRCVPETDLPGSDPYPTVTGPALYISASSGSGNGDGTKAKPFALIAQALPHISGAVTLVVDAGTYAEQVAIAGGVSIVGVAKDRVLLTPPGGVGISVTGAGTTLIEGLTVQGAKGFGIRIEKASATLRNVVVTGTVADGADKPGHGIALQQTGAVSVQNSSLTANAGTGLIAWGCGPIAIIDPLFAIPPVSGVNAGSKIGIIDPLFLPRSEVKGNAAGGIAIIDPLFSPTASAPNLIVQTTSISANGRYGIAVYGASLSVQTSAISGTKGSDMADGILVAPGSTAASTAPAISVDKGSIVTGNGRSGLLVVGPAQAEIGGEFSLNGRGGVWAQHAAASVHLNADAHLARNKMVGAAASGGASLTIDGATIRETQGFDYTPAGASVPVSLADGVGIYAGAHGRIAGAQLIDNPRAAVLGRDCAVQNDGTADLLVSGCTISGSKYGVVVHGTASAMVGGQSPSAPENHYDAVDKAADSADLPADMSVCADGTTACVGAP